MRTVGTAVPVWSLRARADGSDTGATGTFGTGLLFLDWLAKTGQKAWQFLPLSETHLEPGSASIHVPSPYKGYGAGLDPRYLPSEAAAWTPTDTELAAFKAAHAEWLGDHALFSAVRDHYGTDDWKSWEPGIRSRAPEALAGWSEKLQAEIEAKAIEQWKAHKSYGELRGKAKALGITVIGDLPFYLPYQSPLVWANQSLFEIGSDGSMLRVSGVPEGPKAHYGRQVWGHPLYRWSDPASWKGIADLWKLRLRYHAALYDMMRLDHAKGFFNFGAMDPGHPENDAYVDGPGQPLLEDILLSARGTRLTLFAEDAGDRMEELRRTLHQLDVPGIRILRYAYNEKRKSVEPEYADPAGWPERAVGYTTTHDTVTLTGYLKLLSEEEKIHLCEHVKVSYDSDDRMLALRLRGAALASPAHIVILPLQDWLLTDDRINVPGTEKPVGDANWRYRMDRVIEDLPDGLA